MHPLRFTRIAVSALFFAVLAASFLDVWHFIPPMTIGLAVSFQFGPALVGMLSGAFGTALIVAFFVILTLLFGRVYCSHLCPLGVMQDIVIWLRKRNYKHRMYPYRVPSYLFHYAITVLAVFTAAVGSTIVLDLLEPFSNAGRILTHLVRPVVTLTNNVVAIVLRTTHIGMLPDIPLFWPGVWVLVGSAGFLLLIVVLSWRWGRLFCNLLCPVGGILSVLTHRPLFAIHIREHECIDCGLCERVCRAGCIDSKKRTIDWAACVGCFDCLDSCPTHGMEYRWRKARPNATIAPDRRRALGTFAALAATALRKPPERNEAQKKYDAAMSQPVVPPGGVSKELFGSRCTACQLCVSVCPTQVIQPATTEYGWAGIFQARMDYRVFYCTYDCRECTRVCPTGALSPLSLEEKHVVQIGKTTFVKEDCIVETKKKDCGACAEHCPTKAVKMVPYEGKLKIPEVDNEYCVGCGACEHACPTEPRRAIYVTPLAVHGTAKKRPAERTAPVESVPEEFPF